MLNALFMSDTEIYSKPKPFCAVSTGYKSKSHTDVSNLVTKKFHSEHLDVWRTYSANVVKTSFKASLF